MQNITIAPSQLSALLDAVNTANQGKPAERQRVLFIASAPGIGKSSIIRAWADSAKRRFHDIRLAYAAPTDVRGFPMINAEGYMSFAPSSEYPTDEGSVLFLDEFTCAARQTQLAALQLILDKRIGDYHVPDNTLIVLAGNRSVDRAHVERLSSAVVNRIIQVTLSPSVDGWIDWAAGAGVDSRVIAFVKFRPDLLNDFDAAKWDGASAFATPRSWEAVSDLLDSTKSPDLRSAILHGTIGGGAGTEFDAFLRTMDALPDIDEMLKDPDNCEMPSSKPDVQLALAAGLVSRCTPEKIDAVIQLSNRIPKEFQVLTIKCGIKRYPEIYKSSAIAKFVVANAKNLGM